MELESSGVADWLAVVKQGAGAGIVYKRRRMKNDSKVLVWVTIQMVVNFTELRKTDERDKEKQELSFGCGYFDF